MRATGAYVVAVASAVSLAIVAMISPELTRFESTTDRDLLKKAGDLLLMVGVLYAITFAVALPLAAPPFAIGLRILKLWCSRLVAAAVAGCLSAPVALTPLAMLGSMSPDQDVTFGQSFFRLLPGALIIGVAGGLVFGLARRASEPSA